MSLIFHTKPDCVHCAAVLRLAKECSLTHTVVVYDTPAAIINFEASGKTFPYAERTNGPHTYPVGGLSEITEILDAVLSEGI